MTAMTNVEMDRVRLEPSWKQYLLPEFSQDYMQKLKQFLHGEKSQGKVVFPKGDEYFNAFQLTPFDQVKVVILGQDPYHGEGQAHGLCFSVQMGVKTPPSLVNIYKELATDVGFQIPNHGFLQHWAQRGVLLLNSVLTVERGQAASHQGKGWEQFTDKVIDIINQQHQGVVFMLWGSYAQKKGQFIDRQKHLVLTAPHPSPLSAHRGFFGCRHFSQANDYLQGQGKPIIDWQL